IVTRGASDTMLHLVRSSLLHGLPPCLQSRLEILGVQATAPASALKLSFGEAGVIQPSRAGVVDPPIRETRPDKLGDSLVESLLPLLAQPQGFSSRTRFGDVIIDLEDRLELSCFVKLRDPVSGDDHLGAVAPCVHELPLPVTRSQQLKLDLGSRA